MLCYVYVRARVFVSVCFVLARLHQRILRKREPSDSKGLKEQGLYRKGFVYMACGMGFGGGSRGFNIALVLVFVMGTLYLEVCRRPKGF